MPKDEVLLTGIGKTLENTWDANNTTINDLSNLCREIGISLGDMPVQGPQNEKPNIAMLVGQIDSQARLLQRLNAKLQLAILYGMPEEDILTQVPAPAGHNLSAKIMPR